MQKQNPQEKWMTLLGQTQFSLSKVDSWQHI